MGNDLFSIGQKQLLSFARALLRPGKIVIMDEATANIDQKTDDIVQEVVRQKMSDKTVLIIAHRLKTIS